MDTAKRRTLSDISDHDRRLAVEQLHDALDGHDAERDGLGAEAAVALVDALDAGRVDGGSYYGVCGCLFYWLAVAARRVLPAPAGYERPHDAAGRPVYTEEFRAVQALARRYAERWYGSPESGGHTALELVALCVRPGETPETNPAAALLAEGVRDWITKRSPGPEPALVGGPVRG